MSELRQHFGYMANEIVEQDQLESGAMDKVVTSIRVPVNLLAEIDVVANRFGMTRQSLIVEILKNSMIDVIGGGVDGFGKEFMAEVREAQLERIKELTPKGAK